MLSITRPAFGRNRLESLSGIETLKTLKDSSLEDFERRNRLESLSGIETQETLHIESQPSVAIALNPYQGLKQVLTS